MNTREYVHSVTEIFNDIIDDTNVEVRPNGIAIDTRRRYLRNGDLAAGGYQSGYKIVLLATTRLRDARAVLMHEFAHWLTYHYRIQDSTQHSKYFFAVHIALHGDVESYMSNGYLVDSNLTVDFNEAKLQAAVAMFENHFESDINEFFHTLTQLYMKAH